MDPLFDGKGEVTADIGESVSHAHLCAEGRRSHARCTRKRRPHVWISARELIVVSSPGAVRVMLRGWALASVDLSAASKRTTV